MKSKFILFVTYFLAFSLNFMPALKYPDIHVNPYNFFASICFLLALLKALKDSSISSRYSKIFLLCGSLAGAIIYVSDFLAMYDSIIIDVIASIQYPFYIIS